MGREADVADRALLLATAGIVPDESGGGQILLCTDGHGWCQFWEEEPRSLSAGDVVFIPAGVKHWHGAAKDSWFSHVAFNAPGEKTGTEWMEAVSKDQYESLQTAACN